MIFKKINFRLVSIILLIFCVQQIKCKTVSKRSIMQELMNNFMQMIDPKSNQKQMPYKIIKTETIDGAIQKYTVPNVDDEKMKDLNNAIKLLSIQSMLNRHYKNQYRKQKMIKEVENLSKGNENNEAFKKLNEHTLKKYKYIDSYNNHRFNKELAKLQKQAQKLINSSPELFTSVHDEQHFLKNIKDHSNSVSDFYKNSHGTEQNILPNLNSELATNNQQNSQMYVLSPNDISAQAQSPYGKHLKPGKVSDSPHHLKYFSLPMSKESFIKSPYSNTHSLGAQRINTKELFYSRPFRGPNNIPWSMKQKSPEVFLPYQQEMPWSVVPLPPHLPTLNIMSSDNQYKWTSGSKPLTINDNTATNSNINSYWALKPLPPPIGTTMSTRDIKTSSSQISNSEDITLESTSDPYVLNTYSRNSQFKTDMSNENYDDLHMTQESTLKTYTIDNRNKNDSKRDKDDSQQKESTVQQYSINPILAQQYQRYSKQQKNVGKMNNNTLNGNDNNRQKDNANGKSNKKQELIQSSSNQREQNSTNFTRKYTPKHQKQLINPEQTQNFNVNQEKVIQQRQQQLKQFYEKQKQQRQHMRNINKNLMADSKNIQDNAGRSFLFNSKLNTQQIATIPTDIVIPLEESDWIPIQPKFKISSFNSNIPYDQMKLSSENRNTTIPKNPLSNVDVLFVFTNETRVKNTHPQLGNETKYLNMDNFTSEKINNSPILKKVEKTENKNENKQNIINIGNEKIEKVDDAIRQMTFNKPIYDVPILNDKTSVASEKTVVLELVSSKHLEEKNKLHSEEDIQGSESNTIPVRIQYSNPPKGLGNESSIVKHVRQYERVKVKVKNNGKIENSDQSQNKLGTNSLNTTVVPNYVTNGSDSINHKSQGSTEISDHVNLEETKSNNSTSKNIEQNKTNVQIQNTNTITTSNLPIQSYENNIKNTRLEDNNKNYNGSNLQEGVSLVSNKTVITISNVTPTTEDQHKKEGMQNISKKIEALDPPEEYDFSSTNIRELIANRSKIIRPFFRNKQNLTFSSTTATTTTTRSTTLKPIIIQSQAQEVMKDQKFEESKTHNNYDDYDEHLSFENIKAAQAFNFPKTEISYNVNTPKSSQSVFKSIENERLVNSKRKPNLRNKYGNTHQSGHHRQKDQSDYENREEQTHLSPTYDKNVGQYNVYENTAPFEGGGSFYNDDDTSTNGDVDVKNIRIPSPDEIDLDNIDIPNPETIGVKGVDLGNDEDNDGEKEEDGVDENSEKDSDNEEDLEEDRSGDDADNEESKTRKQIDKSLKEQTQVLKAEKSNEGQDNSDSMKSHSEKNFGIASIPIPEYNEEKMNHIKEKYNIPELSIGNLENENDNRNLEEGIIKIPKDHLIRNEYQDEVPDYNVPLDFSQERNANEENEYDERFNTRQSVLNEGSQRPFYDSHHNTYTLNNDDHNFPFISAADKSRMRDLLKRPAEDQFDQDEDFGYGKFSNENQDDFASDDARNDAFITQESERNRINNQADFYSNPQSVPQKYSGKVIESHIVKQIPIAFKTVIKPVLYNEGHFSSKNDRYKYVNSGITHPFRSRVQQDINTGRPNLQLKYSEQSKYANEQFGRSLQPEILPALEFKLTSDEEQFSGNPHNQYKATTYVPTPHKSQDNFVQPETNEQANLQLSFNPKTETRSQMPSLGSQIESSNNPSHQNLLSYPKKAESFSDSQFYHNNPSSLSIRVPTGKNGTNRDHQNVQSLMRQPESVQTFLNHHDPNDFQNQARSLSHKIPSESTTTDFKQALIIYHPTKSQVKSISHVLVTPPTVERQKQNNKEPQIQEKNFQQTMIGPIKPRQNGLEIQQMHRQYEPKQNSDSNRSLDPGRYRYLKNYNRGNQQNFQQTKPLQNYKQQSGIPQYVHILNNPTAPPSMNNLNNISVRNHFKSYQKHKHLQSPRPFTIHKIQSIKSTNSPVNHDHSHLKQYDPTQIRYISRPQKINYFQQSIPLEQSKLHPHELYQAQHPVLELHNTESYNYDPHLFGQYNENSNSELPTNDEANESEEDNNNSDETHDNDGQLDHDPNNHDTYFKGNYLYTNDQQEGSLPQQNDFVQNIKLLKKIPKIEKLRVTNEYTNVNVNQYNKYHPESAKPQFLPTPSPEMHVATPIKQKGKGKNLVFTPSQQDPFTNQLEIGNSPYTLDDNIQSHHLQSQLQKQSHFSNGILSTTPSVSVFPQHLKSLTLSPPTLSPNIAPSTVSPLPSHFASSPSSIPEHPLPLLRPQQYLPSTTPLTPFYTSVRPEEQPQLIQTEREQVLQIQSPVQSAYNPLEPQLQSIHQLNVPEEHRQQFFINQQYPYEIQRENTHLNQPSLQQHLLESFNQPQPLIQHQLPRPQHRLPLGYPPSPDIQQFEINNPQPTPVQIPHPPPYQRHQGFAPSPDHYQITDHPLIEEQQYLPPQNVYTAGRMIQTIYPYKKSDENHLIEQSDIYPRENSDLDYNEPQNKNELKQNRNQNRPRMMDEIYPQTLLEYNSNSRKNRYLDANTAQTELVNSRTDSKIQFDYVDGKTRIQPHGLHEHLKFEESKYERIAAKDSTEGDKKNITNKGDQNALNNAVKEYIDLFNRQESNKNELRSEPDVVIQKSLQTEYKIPSDKGEIAHEENRFVPLNYVTPTTNIHNSENIKPNIQKSNIQGFQLPGRLVKNNVESPNPQEHVGPQIQIHHFTKHIVSANGENMQNIHGNNHAFLKNTGNSKSHETSSQFLPTVNLPNFKANTHSFVKSGPKLSQHQPNIGTFFQNPFHDTTKVPSNNIDPSQYSIRNTDMPTVTLNKADKTAFQEKPNVNSFVQFEHSSKINSQKAAKTEPAVIIPHNTPLVLNPALFIKTLSQSSEVEPQNEKIKIIIPTLTDNQLQKKNIQYKIPKDDINRFQNQVKPNLNPQSFQNGNTLSQPYSFSSSSSALKNQNNKIQNNFHQNQPLSITYYPKEEQQNLNKHHTLQTPNFSNNIVPQQVLQRVPSNNQNSNTHLHKDQQFTLQAYQNNQVVQNIPNTHHHYDIFGEYGQKRPIKEPYRFEPLLNGQQIFTQVKTNQFTRQPAFQGYGVQNKENYFQPSGQQIGFNHNPLYKYQNQQNDFKPVRPQLSEPVLVPSSLVNGIESASLVSKKVQHPTIHDLTFQQSKLSTHYMNIADADQKNKITNNSKNKEGLESNLELIPLTTFVPMTESMKKLNHNLNENQTDHVTLRSSTSEEIMMKSETSHGNFSRFFHFENNQNNIPILFFANNSNQRKIKENENKQENKRNENSEKNDSMSNSDWWKSKDKIIEPTIKETPGYSYDNSENLDKNRDLHTDNFEAMDGFLTNNNNNTLTKSKTKKAIFEKYMDSLSKSYDFIRESIKKEDDKEKIDISSLYSTDVNKINKKSPPKQLFDKNVNITHTNSKGEEEISFDSKDDSTHQPKPNMYGRTIDINYFNQKKNWSPLK